MYNDLHYLRPTNHLLQAPAGGAGWPLPTGFLPPRSIIFRTGGPAGADKSGSGSGSTRPRAMGMMAVMWVSGP